MTARKKVNFLPFDNTEKERAAIIELCKKIRICSKEDIIARVAFATSSEDKHLHAIVEDRTSLEGLLFGKKGNLLKVKENTNYIVVDLGLNCKLTIFPAVT